MPYLLGFVMFLTAGVLFAGIISFAFGSRGSSKHATKLMTARVVLQALAIILFGVLVFFNLS